MEKTLKKLDETWRVVEFQFTQHKDTDIYLMKLAEEDFEMLEENQVQVTGMTSSRYLATFEEEVISWQKNLADISETNILIGEVQRSWSFLENLFIHSEEVKKELPTESDRFKGIDQKVKDILKNGFQNKLALKFCCQDWLMPALNDV
jgi:dynein heavy chain